MAILVPEERYGVSRMFGHRSWYAWATGMLAGILFNASSRPECGLDMNPLGGGETLTIRVYPAWVTSKSRRFSSATWGRTEVYGCVFCNLRIGCARGSPVSQGREWVARGGKGMTTRATARVHHILPEVLQYDSLRPLPKADVEKNRTSTR